MEIMAFSFYKEIWEEQILSVSRNLFSVPVLNSTYFEKYLKWTNVAFPQFMNIARGSIMFRSHVVLCFLGFFNVLKTCFFGRRWANIVIKSSVCGMFQIQYIFFRC